MLAKAGFAETSQTLDVLTTILNAYGMSADKVGTVSDMLVQIQNKGKVTVGELSSVMGKIIPTANSYNVSLEQLGATYAIMTSKGIAAAETTTYANSMLNEMGKSGTTADKALRQAAGKGFADLMASGMSLGDVLAILQTEAEKSGKTIADMFGSAEAGKAAVSLLSNGVDGFNASVADMINSTGMTQSAFDKMAGTTENKMAKAKNSITNLGIVLGQNLLPIVGNVADKVAVLVTKVAEFAQENPKLVQTVLKVAAGLAAFKIAGLGAKLGFLHIKSGFTTAKIVLETFKSKAALAQVASAGLVSKLRAAGSGIMSIFGGMGSGLGKVAGLVLKPFSLLGGKLGGILSGLGSVIAKSPLGSIGKFITAGFGKLGGVIAPIGNIFKKVLGPIGKIGSSLLGPLGGIAGKLFPVVGIVTGVITAVQLLRNHFDEVRAAIGRIFGEGGLAVFDKIVAVVTTVGETIKGVFSDGNLGAARDKIEEIFGAKGAAVFDSFINVINSVRSTLSTLVGFITEHIVPVAEQILSVIVTNVIPGILGGIQAAAPVIMQIVQSIADFIAGIMPIIGDFIAGIMPVISEIITFIQTYVLPVIQEVFNFIVAEVLPFIVQGIQTLGSIITTVLSAVLPVVQTVFQTIWSIIQPIMQQILTVVQAVLPAVLSIFQNVFNTIGSIISAVQQVLGGIIQFITGVFTGNWSQAWEGIKSIFGGIWDAILSVCKGVINGITGAVNVVIRGLNCLKVPDWVPGIGGMGINIPEIPQLAVGSRNTPDTFIAGEKGPELITNMPGRTVYTAAQTQQIMERSRSAAASVAGAAAQGIPAPMPQVQTARAPEVIAAGGGGGYTITLHNSPTIVVDGNRPDDLDQKLEENNRRLLREFEEAVRKKEDDERRSDYE
jgi:TP901 family phage tail tape measure protein